MLIGMANT